MKLKARYYDVDSEEARVMIHDDDCVEIGLMEGDRAVLNGKVIAIVSKSDTVCGCGTILVPEYVAIDMGLKQGDFIDVTSSSKPDSAGYIRKKMEGSVLSREEIKSIVEDIDHARLSQIEISAWITALYIRGMNMEETAYLTKSMADSGSYINFTRDTIFDFHSIGGVPGNKITPIVVSIITSAGLMLPKLSSRAISSACGTSDFVEVFCDVELDNERFKAVVEKTGGSFALGGSIGIAPAGDIAIKVQYPLGVDPRSQMLASIMSKKVAVGTTHLLIDIPTGPETKARTIEDARAYASEFTELGRLLGIKVSCAITSGDQPIGCAIGPSLEARECIRVLEGSTDYPSVVEKACTMAGKILEMSGVLDGATEARRILSSGEALAKFREIVSAQGGNYDVSSEDIVPGKYSVAVRSECNGFVNAISNKSLVNIARKAGSPGNKGAGILLMKRRGQRVEKGDVLFEIYSDVKLKCEDALNTAEKLKPVSVEGTPL